ncbi:hypothetical protein DXD94_06825 [Collinsella sp. TM10-22]|nr:hypothetical protein DXD94_06825 [Collinsella sp. TM10-22]
MAMRLADTFLVHRRSCFAILFSGQTPHWSLPRSFLGEGSQPPPSDAGTFVIAFLDSYEVRFKVRRRTRGADGRRHLRRNKRK